MKNETQAVRLANMMQRQPLCPKYELALPLIQIKKSALKKLSEGDVLLLGFENLEMILMEGQKNIAEVRLERTRQNSIEIVSLNKEIQNQMGEKKYKLLKCSFGFVQSRKIEVGHKISISSLNLEAVELFSGETCVAQGFLVNVDEEIAIQIKKVN